MSYEMNAAYQTRVEAHDSLEDYPTPPWATRALCEALRTRTRKPLPFLTCREPAANRGHMARPLQEYFGSVQATDVHDYGVGFPVSDYLFGQDPAPVDWTITNPPFRLASEFIARGIATSRRGVAVFVRTAFLEGTKRNKALFQPHPPTLMLQFAERVNLFKGQLDPNGSKPVSYCWLVWERGRKTSRLAWIPPCRKELERPEDYQ